MSTLGLFMRAVDAVVLAPLVLSLADVCATEEVLAGLFCSSSFSSSSASSSIASFNLNFTSDFGLDMISQSSSKKRMNSDLVLRIAQEAKAFMGLSNVTFSTATRFVMQNCHQYLHD